MDMAKKSKNKTGSKSRKKEIMAKILHNISAAMKDYARPASERKLERKIRKAKKKESTHKKK
jgi:hypothetical protein